MQKSQPLRPSQPPDCVLCPPPRAAAVRAAALIARGSAGGADSSSCGTRAPRDPSAAPRGKQPRGASAPSPPTSRQRQAQNAPLAEQQRRAAGRTPQRGMQGRKAPQAPEHRAAQQMAPPQGAAASPPAPTGRGPCTARCIACGLEKQVLPNNPGFFARGSRAYTCHACCFRNRSERGFYGPPGTRSLEEAGGRVCVECGDTEASHWAAHKTDLGAYVCSPCAGRRRRSGLYDRRPVASRTGEVEAAAGGKRSSAAGGAEVGGDFAAGEAPEGAAGARGAGEPRRPAKRLKSAQEAAPPAAGAATRRRSGHAQQQPRPGPPLPMLSPALPGHASPRVGGALHQSQEAAEALWQPREPASPPQRQPEEALLRQALNGPAGLPQSGLRPSEEAAPSGGGTGRMAARRGGKAAGAAEEVAGGGSMGDAAAEGDSLLGRPGAAAADREDVAGAAMQERAAGEEMAGAEAAAERAATTGASGGDSPGPDTAPVAGVAAHAARVPAGGGVAAADSAAGQQGSAKCRAAAGQRDGTLLRCKRRRLVAPEQRPAAAAGQPLVVAPLRPEAGVGPSHLQPQGTRPPALGLKQAPEAQEALAARRAQQPGPPFGCIACGTPYNPAAKAARGFFAHGSRAYTCNACCRRNQSGLGFYGPVGTRSLAEAGGRACAQCGISYEQCSTWRPHPDSIGAYMCLSCAYDYKLARHRAARIARGADGDGAAEDGGAEGAEPDASPGSNQDPAPPLPPPSSVAAPEHAGFSGHSAGGGGLSDSEPRRGRDAAASAAAAALAAVPQDGPCSADARGSGFALRPHAGSAAYMAERVMPGPSLDEGAASPDAGVVGVGAAPSASAMEEAPDVPVADPMTAAAAAAAAADVIVAALNRQAVNGGVGPLAGAPDATPVQIDPAEVARGEVLPQATQLLPSMPTEAAPTEAEPLDAAPLEADPAEAAPAEAAAGPELLSSGRRAGPLPLPRSACLTPGVGATEASAAAAFAAPAAAAVDRHRGFPAQPLPAAPELLAAKAAALPDVGAAAEAGTTTAGAGEAAATQIHTLTSAATAFPALPQGLALAASQAAEGMSRAPDCGQNGKSGVGPGPAAEDLAGAAPGRAPERVRAPEAEASGDERVEHVGQPAVSAAVAAVAAAVAAAFEPEWAVAAGAGIVRPEAHTAAQAAGALAAEPQPQPTATHAVVSAGTDKPPPPPPPPTAAGLGPSLALVAEVNGAAGAAFAVPLAAAALQATPADAAAEAPAGLEAAAAAAASAQPNAGPLPLPLGGGGVTAFLMDMLTEDGPVSDLLAQVKATEGAVQTESVSGTPGQSHVLVRQDPPGRWDAAVPAANGTSQEQELAQWEQPGPKAVTRQEAAASGLVPAVSEADAAAAAGEQTVTVAADGAEPAGLLPAGTGTAPAAALAPPPPTHDGAAIGAGTKVMCGASISVVANAELAPAGAGAAGGSPSEGQPSLLGQALSIAPSATGLAAAVQASAREPPSECMDAATEPAAAKTHASHASAAAGLLVLNGPVSELDGHTARSAVITGPADGTAVAGCPGGAEARGTAGSPAAAAAHRTAANNNAPPLRNGGGASGGSSGGGGREAVLPAGERAAEAASAAPEGDAALAALRDRGQAATAAAGCLATDGRLVTSTVAAGQGCEHATAATVLAERQSPTKRRRLESPLITGPPPQLAAPASPEPAERDEGLIAATGTAAQQLSGRADCAPSAPTAAVVAAPQAAAGAAAAGGGGHSTATDEQRSLPPLASRAPRLPETLDDPPPGQVQRCIIVNAAVQTLRPLVTPQPVAPRAPTDPRVVPPTTDSHPTDPRIARAACPNPERPALAAAVPPLSADAAVVTAREVREGARRLGAAAGAAAAADDGPPNKRARSHAGGADGTGTAEQGGGSGTRAALHGACQAKRGAYARLVGIPEMPDTPPDPRVVDGWVRELERTVAAACRGLVQLEEAGGAGGAASCGAALGTGQPGASLTPARAKARARRYGDFIVRWLQAHVWPRCMALMLGPGAAASGLDLDVSGPYSGMAPERQALWDRQRAAAAAGFAAASDVVAAEREQQQSGAGQEAVAAAGAAALAAHPQACLVTPFAPVRLRFLLRWLAEQLEGGVAAAVTAAGAAGEVLEVGPEPPLPVPPLDVGRPQPPPTSPPSEALRLLSGVVLEALRLAYRIVSVSGASLGGYLCICLPPSMPKPQDGRAQEAAQGGGGHARGPAQGQGQEGVHGVPRRLWVAAPTVYRRRMVEGGDVEDAVLVNARALWAQPEVL